MQNIGYCVTGLWVIPDISTSWSTVCAAAADGQDESWRRWIRMEGIKVGTDCACGSVKQQTINTTSASL